MSSRGKRKIRATIEIGKSSGAMVSFSEVLQIPMGAGEEKIAELLQEWAQSVIHLVYERA